MAETNSEQSGEVLERLKRDRGGQEENSSVQVDELLTKKSKKSSDCFATKDSEVEKISQEWSQLYKRELSHGTVEG